MDHFPPSIQVAESARLLRVRQRIVEQLTRDVAGETASQHIRNALQILSPLSGEIRDALVSRLNRALVCIERGPLT